MPGVNEKNPVCSDSARVDYTTVKKTHRERIDSAFVDTVQNNVENVEKNDSIFNNRSDLHCETHNDNEEYNKRLCNGGFLGGLASLFVLSFGGNTPDSSRVTKFLSKAIANAKNPFFTEMMKMGVLCGIITTGVTLGVLAAYITKKLSNEEQHPEILNNNVYQPDEFKV